MITNTGSEQFVTGFMAGQMGLDIPEDATEEQKQAYERGLKVREAEKENAEWDK